jgi:hypothetical protein
MKNQRLCQRDRESIFDLIMMNGEEALTAVQANLQFACREYKNL